MMKYGIKYTEGSPIMSITRFRNGVLAEGFQEITKEKYDDLVKKKQEDPYGTYDGQSFVNEPLAQRTERVNAQAFKNELLSIDADTRKRIEDGFIFDGHTFSMSQNAQINWNNIASMYSIGLFPTTEGLNVSIKDDVSTYYVLTYENVIPFLTAYKDKKMTELEVGRANRMAVYQQHQ